MTKNTHAKTLSKVTEALQNLLADGKVSTHEEIITALQKQGFSVNQPKVSRLLRKIGAIKVNTTKGHVYRLPHTYGLAHEFAAASTANSLKEVILYMGANENLVVIRTLPGGAPLVARAIDE